MAIAKQTTATVIPALRRMPILCRRLIDPD
jgi:hypothetical protein